MVVIQKNIQIKIIQRFQRNGESTLQESQVNTSQPYKCKVVSSLAAYVS